MSSRQHQAISPRRASFSTVRGWRELAAVAVAQADAVGQRGSGVAWPRVMGVPPMRRPWRTAAIKLSMGAIRGGLLCRSRGVIGCPTALLIMPVLFGDKEAEDQGQVPYTVQYTRVRRHADAAGHEMLRAVTSNTAVRLAKWSHPILSSNVAFCLRHRRFDAALGRQSAKPRSPLPTATDRARPIALNWMRHCTPSSARPGWPCILTRSASTCLKSFPAPGQPPAGHSRLTPLR
jgi:hypothetical protein